MKVISRHISDDIFKEILSFVPICTVDIVFFNKEKNKILLCKRINQPLEGVYFINGGRLFKNEELEDCAVRQAKTELGISVDKNKLIFGGVSNEIFDTSRFENVGYHAMDVFFGYIIDENIEIKFDEQHSDHKWFQTDDLRLHPFIKRRIDSLIKKL